MRKMKMSKTDYSMEETEDGFIFRIREDGYERAVVIGEITVTAADKFFDVLVENDVKPGHLLPVAEDYDFASVALVTAF